MGHRLLFDISLYTILLYIILNNNIKKTILEISLASKKYVVMYWKLLILVFSWYSININRYYYFFMKIDGF